MHSAARLDNNYHLHGGEKMPLIRVIIEYHLSICQWHAFTTEANGLRNMVGDETEEKSELHALKTICEQQWGPEALKSRQSLICRVRNHLKSAV